MKKIVITGGHITPAAAVIDEFAGKKEWKIYFFGRLQASEGDKTLSVEKEIVEEKGAVFVPIRAGRIQRKFTQHTIKAALRLPLGVIDSIVNLAKVRPSVVLSFGGYISVPVIFAAWILGIPSITHEQTTVHGLATKINAIFVRKIAISWRGSEIGLPKEKTIFTGLPLRKEIFEKQAKWWNSLSFDQKLPMLFVTGGNQGSHAVNMAINEALPYLLKKMNIFHQVGHLESLGDFGILEKKKRGLSADLRKRYQIKKYITASEMGAVMNKADVIVTRGGINTISELMALGKVAVIIPLPWLYKNEQLKNAEMMKGFGGAIILRQDDLSGERLIKSIEEAFLIKKTNKEKIREMAKSVPLDGAKKIVNLVESMAG